MDQDNEARYARSAEVLQILKQCWTQNELAFKGDFYDIARIRTDAPGPSSRTAAPCSTSVASHRVPRSSAPASAMSS
nr:hypothetical protein [Verrucomicrobium spinosum]